MLGTATHAMTDGWIRVVEEVASVAHQLGEPKSAATLLHIADQTRTAGGLPATPRRRPELDELHQRLGDVPPVVEAERPRELLAALALRADQLARADKAGP